ncbi:MAG: hypothetical protein E7172_00480 [Firmicutes bacterium]|nr:hypothetical protein [Bacillota bacterium]
MDFIYKLYQTDNFTVILTVAIILLIILFFVVLLFGKKDQKLEETKRLQKLELDTFKEEKKDAVKVEVKEEKEIKEEKIEENKKLPEKIVENETKLDDLEVTVTVFEPEKKEIETKEEKTDTKELIIAKPEDFNELEKEIENSLNDLQKIKNEFNRIEIPKVEKENSVSSKTSTNVFSSVYVKENQEVKNTSIIDEEDDDFEFDLPTLKEEAKEKTMNIKLDDLVGETYDINKDN